MRVWSVGALSLVSCFTVAVLPPGVVKFAQLLDLHVLGQLLNRGLDLVASVESVVAESAVILDTVLHDGGQLLTVEHLGVGISPSGLFASWPPGLKNEPDEW